MPGISCERLAHRPLGRPAARAKARRSQDFEERMGAEIVIGQTGAGTPAGIDLEELLATRLLVQGNSGSGKSYLLRRLLEQSAGLVQQIVIDPEGDLVSLAERYGRVVLAAADCERELATIAEYNIPVKVCILNNDFQGMVKQWQDLFYNRRYSQTVMKNPNFSKMAEAFGIKGIRCDNKSDVPKVVGEMLAHDGPVLVDFFVEPNEHVYPMVPSGKGLHEMEMGTLA